MKRKRILFTGGGTAGHVIVNLALIPVFQEKGWEIDYIGSKNGIEKDLVQQLEGVTYHAVSTGKLRRYMSKENLKDPFKVLKGTMQSCNIIRKRKPSVIFSKGGFVSVPVMIASKLLRVPAVIHESDYTPGLANKIAIPFSRKVLATFEETLRYLPEKKAEYVGAVIRKELFSGEKAKGLAFAGLEGKRPVLLVMGGSGGSEKINSAIREGLDRLLETYEIIHICGKGKMAPEFDCPGYRQFEYVQDELKDIFAATDYVLSRAGSNAIFEFLALRIPMLLVPLGLNASRGDQIVNAKSFAEKRYARVLDEDQLTTETLAEELEQLKEYGPIMVDQMRQTNASDSLQKVVSIIENTSK
ncbi:undecaprenyldiphospho-muramoylpentapeptide beta-N-acetylglucosaminyltransferase [Aciduricibacillus chroicocephali]|uniref:UDP-N-acetylglucosamine--N-acetylmuramyl-(pentapeptide) pyrophosphoryl-undecaprenol N-acetylglucosamine transferase n=1 Tax=Aciduricibacillus chroicocephali TaxID=3054939 RepID=A0ABY9KXH6_9BACI|nr:undecaprenyldiphospho-muramoylpentapeptide beta-N-acetylglucosaminyltransferase [Bacillaceae bacterium 44XB]